MVEPIIQLDVAHVAFPDRVFMPGADQRVRRLVLALTFPEVFRGRGNGVGADRLNDVGNRKT